MTATEENKKNILYSGFVPKWLFYTALVIVIGGIVKGLSRATPEEYYFMIMWFVSFAIILIDEVGGYFKKKK